MTRKSLRDSEEFDSTLSACDECKRDKCECDHLRDNAPKPPCHRCELGSPVSHDGSRFCRMRDSIAAGGTVAHCTCQACF